MSTAIATLTGMLLAIIVQVQMDPGKGAAWNRYRGPNGTGIARGSYPATIGPEAKTRWVCDFPAGFSSPILSRNKVFLTGLEGEQLFTYALDRETGETLWRRESPRPRRTKFHSDNHPAAASAAVDEDTVAVFFDEYGMLAYDHEGEERWRLPLGPFDNIYGMGASPVIVGEVVVLPCDQSIDSYVLGVDKRDGTVRWKVARPQAVSGHCTPVVRRAVDGRDEVLLPGSFQLIAYDALTGEERWWVNGLPGEMKSVPVLLGDTLWIHGYASPANNLGNQIEMPEFDEGLEAMDGDGDGRVARAELTEERVGRLFPFFDLDSDGSLDAGEWKMMRASLAAVNCALAVKVGGEGDVTEGQVLWDYYRGIPQLPSPLIYGDVYYMLGDQSGLITLLDPATGELIEKGRLEDGIDAYYASPVAGDGKIYLLGQSGLLTVLETDKGLDAVHTASFGEQCYATPTLEDGRIWVRTAGKLYCF